MKGFSRSGWVLLLDVALAGASFALAVWLRLGDRAFDVAAPYLTLGAFLSIIISLPVYLQFRQPRGMWRYVSLRDLTVLLRSAFVIIAFTYAAFFVVQRLEGIPRSLPLIQLMALVMLLAAPRVLYRLLQEGHLSLASPQPEAQAEEQECSNVLLVGTGPQAEQFLRTTQSHKCAPYHVVGLLDNAGVGGRIHGVAVYGPISSLPRILEKLEQKNMAPDTLVLTDPDMPGAKIREWLEIANEQGLGLLRMPSTLDLADADAPITLKPVAVEDLLGRQQAELDRNSMAELIAGKRVLVTGAGGSIGSELARQILHFNPSALTLMDSSEYALYQIEQEILQDPAVASVPVYCMLGDVRDRQRLEQVFTFQQPQIVFHAAAIKHVPVAERDCEEAILTNVFGTQHVAECCMNHGSQTMVLISTDKAVEPSNIMGATKRLAERYFLWLSQQRAVRNAGTQFLTVRFGNVLGSTGSVLPLFQRQLLAGGPLTVTHPEMRRYFMTIGEAVQLVLQAAAIGHTQPEKSRGGIFVLDMGDPVKIEDLARRVIQLAGLRPGEDVQIAYSGIRPGEKLDEALFYDEEVVKETQHQSILLAVGEQVDVQELAEGLVSLEDACLNRDREHAFAQLQNLVPEYIPFQWPGLAEAS
jgi:FlaA1/EpsC-like NDP-sugar epimerase